MAKQKRKTHDPDVLSRLWSNIVLAGRLLFDSRVSGVAKLIPLLLVIYILSPVDLIPDVFVPIGIVDDLTAFLVGLQLFILCAPAGVVAEYRHKPERRPHKATPKPDDPRIIEGDYIVHDDRDKTIQR
ncbi:MAG TPA: YkvA family protein [Aggregatilineaceae bacterium]|jgi:uncharacterized membrane protein YkvA (DUF1232 family)|nr:YkvA family protein [Aggregatilineaceae bacterium]